MSLSRRALLAFWLTMQLVLAQQFALAHHVDHLAETMAAHAAEAEAGLSDGEEREGAAHLLAHACTTCIACIGLGTALAIGSTASLAVTPLSAQIEGAVLPAPTFHRPPAFHSRAPPSYQD